MRKRLAFFTIVFGAFGCGPAPVPSVEPSVELPVTSPAAPPAAPVVIPIASEPMPKVPEYAASLMGKSLSEVGISEIASCIGNADLVSARYEAPPGIQILGWAWDPVAVAPFSEFLVVNDGMIVGGFGVGGLPRPDVPQVHADIKTDAVGYTAYAISAAEPYVVLGYHSSAKTVCRVGTISTP